jgi:hypothetical protein
LKKRSHFWVVVCLSGGTVTGCHGDGAAGAFAPDVFVDLGG